MRSTPGPGEAGTASLVLPMLLWVATIAAIALIDVTAYLVAAARAQSLADAAALAAVSVDPSRSGGGEPHGRAANVVTAGGGHLERCRCATGGGRVSTEVSVPVPGLVLPRLGAARVSAAADAVLAPPDGLSPPWTPTGDRRGPVG